MTATPPPANCQLWHPTRGISFSPTRSPLEPPSKKPVVITQKSFTTSCHVLSQDPVTRPNSLSEKQDTQTIVSETIALENDAPTNVDECKVEGGLNILEPPPAVLPFAMDETLFNEAKKAPPGSTKSFWSYLHYRGPPVDGEPQKVKVHLCRSFATMNKVCQKYFMNARVLGFDLEWEVWASKSSASRRYVSTIQVATYDHIAIIQIAVFPENNGSSDLQFKKLMAQSKLKEIMENPNITKVGVAIKGDATRLKHVSTWEDADPSKCIPGIESRGLIELSHLYRLVTCCASKEYKKISKRLVTLATQVKDFLRLPLNKGEVRSSDWKQALNLEQIIYSASDSYAGLQLYATFEYYRKQLDPCPPHPPFAEENKPVFSAEVPPLGIGDEEIEMPEQDAPAVPTPSSDEVVLEAVESIEIEEDVASPLESGSELEAGAGAEQQQQQSEDAKPKARTRRKPVSSKQQPAPPLGSRHPQVEIAEDRAQRYLAAHPDARVSLSPLRAYYLWHNGGLEPAAMAWMLGIKDTTAISYVIQAIKFQNLAYDEERFLVELALPLPAFLRNKFTLVNKAILNMKAREKLARTTTTTTTTQMKEDENRVVP